MRIIKSFSPKKITCINTAVKIEDEMMILILAPPAGEGSEYFTNKMVSRMVVMVMREWMSSIRTYQGGEAGYVGFISFQS